MSELKYEILDEEGYLKESIADLIEEVFESFDVDKDGVLNSEELQAFSVKLNGKPFSKEELKEIEEYFDIDDNGFITKAGFHQMFDLQSSAEPEETIKDLETLGYDLEKYLEK
ncbi:hypothetical protein K502DRAFT_322761 [Neoconidiobolus thromboides FSU 785]|nr:hypothetical protein K502DRAFT_322761 [Neoconidiobolus thromboides FSU 785]